MPEPSEDSKSFHYSFLDFSEQEEGEEDFSDQQLDEDN